MKKYSVYTLIFAMILLLSNCEENENPIFDNINGQTMSQFVGSGVTIAALLGETNSVDITVLVTTISTVDRVIDVTSGPASTAGPTQYTIQNLLIPAGSYEGTLTVAANFDALPVDNSTVVLDLTLTGIDGGGAVDNGTYSISMFRFCPIPGGDYVVNMTDSFGDGWQTDDANGGSGMTATIIDENGVQTVVEFGICSFWGAAAGTFLGGTDCTSGSFTSGSVTITVPDNARDLIWTFPGDWWGEIGFEIIAPDGTVINSTSTGAGQLGVVPVSYCF